MIKKEPSLYCDVCNIYAEKFYCLDGKIKCGYKDDNGIGYCWSDPIKLHICEPCLEKLTWIKFPHE